MSDVFDAISMFLGSRQGGQISALHSLLSASDFDNRLGKRAYVSWLERVSGDGSLYTLLLEAQEHLHPILQVVSKQNRMIDICRDSLHRKLNLSFVLKASEMMLRDCVSSNEGPDSENLLNLILGNLKLWSHEHFGRGKDMRNAEITVVPMIVRLCLLSAFFPRIDFIPTLSGLLSLNCGITSLCQLGPYIGHDLVYLLKALMGNRMDFDIIRGTQYGDPKFISRCISTRGVVRLGISETVDRKRPTGLIAKVSVCAIDSLLCARLCVLRKDYTGLDSIIGLILSQPTTAFTRMFFHYGIIGSVLFAENDPRLGERRTGNLNRFIVAAVAKGLIDRPSFYMNLLEYLVLQLKEVQSHNSALIAEELRREIPRTCVELIQLVKVVDAFIKMHSKSAPRGSGNEAPEEPPPIHDEFAKLVSILKRKR